MNDEPIADAGSQERYKSIAKSLDTYRVQGKVVADETLAKEALVKGAEIASRALWR